MVTIVGSIPNNLVEDWANSRSTHTSIVALLNERIEDNIMSLTQMQCVLRHNCIMIAECGL